MPGQLLVSIHRSNGFYDFDKALPPATYSFEIVPDDKTYATSFVPLTMEADGDAVLDGMVSAYLSTTTKPTSAGPYDLGAGVR